MFSGCRSIDLKIVTNPILKLKLYVIACRTGGAHSSHFCRVLKQQQAWATDDVAQIYDKCMADLEQHLHAIPPSLAMNPLTQSLRSLLEAVALARNSRDGIAALGLLQKVGEGDRIQKC